MRKRIILYIFLLSCYCASAQVLYKISGNGITSPSYLFATNKLVDISFLDTIPNLFKCYGAANKVITEFAMEDYQAISALRQAAILPDSVKLQRYYSEEQYTAIDEALRLTLGMGLDKLCRMKPQYLTEMYRMELLKKWAGYDENRSAEHFFEAVAQQQNKPIYGLDDIGETMFITFDREPFHWQCEELASIIEYPEREVRQEKTMCALYKMGRLLDISYQVSSPDNQSSISFSDYKVYTKRNKVWVKRLAPYLKEGGAFITLDAVYLGGDEGLINLLRKAGYKVKPVNR